ncbi:Ig-like domain-containing protein [bacterium]|nr:Ig-like domain-containing protein [bacterium]
MAAETDGVWGDVFNTEIMAIHQVLLGDGRVLYWGDDGSGNAFSNTMDYAIYDPQTGTFEVQDAAFVVRMFCGAGVIIPGTDQVLVAAGNGAGDDDVRVFDTSDENLVNESQYLMAEGRFYPTMVSLSTGQLVILGGNAAGTAAGGGVGTPEIFTEGEGWRKLDGAADADVAGNWWYPKAWVNSAGEVLYIAMSGMGGNERTGTNPAGTFEVMALDVSGDGSIRQVAEVPFQMDVRSSAVMYDVGKIVVMDHVGDLWIMDINGETPTFTFAADLPTDRENSDMTVMADGRVLLNGGTTTGNSQEDADAVFQSVIFDPYTGDVSFVDSEDVLRVYHSSSLLLPDGTIISAGGGGLGYTRDFQDAQIYMPDYLFNDDGTLADRPEIFGAPDQIEPGDSFVVIVDDAATIAQMSFVKTGAVTHSVNMESGRMDLEFTVLSPTQIEVTLPENPHVVGAGNWMLFAIDDDGVPSEAPIITVMPTIEPFEHRDGDLTVEYFVLDAGVTSLNQIDFDQAADFTEDARIININTNNGTAFEGGPSDNFAAQYTGDFEVETAGNYTFYLNSDDGAQLYIDGALVINNDGVHAARLFTATVNLSSGAHAIEVRYFEAGGEAVLDLDWAGPGFSREQMEFVDAPAPIAGYDETGPILASDLSDATGGVVKINGTNILENDSDANGDALSIVEVNGAPVTASGWQGWRDASNGGQIVVNTDGRVQFRDPDGDFATLPDGELRETSITYTISDGNGGTSQATITFVVEGEAVVGENVAPVAVDDLTTSLFGSTATITVSDLTDDAGNVVKINGRANVLANDSDANGDTLGIVEINGAPVTSPGWQGWRDASNGGQITLNTDGRVQFRDVDGDFDDLPLGEVIQTSITYTISDGNGGTAQATISFAVEGEAVVGPNVDPVAEDDDFGPFFTSELLDAGGSVVKINGTNVLSNDSDANGDELDIVAIDGSAVTADGWQGWRDASNGGQIVLNTDGRVQFRADDFDLDFGGLAEGETVDTSLVYEISDGNGGTDTATVTFTIAVDDIVLALDSDLGDTIV